MDILGKYALPDQLIKKVCPHGEITVIGQYEKNKKSSACSSGFQPGKEC